MDIKSENLYGIVNGQLVSAEAQFTLLDAEKVYIVEPHFDINLTKDEYVLLLDPPSSAHELICKAWVLNKEKQQAISELESANAKIKLADEARQNKLNQLDNITVTTSSGKSFDGNETARINMLSAITASEITGQTQAGWKLAGNSVAMVSVDEIKEALALSIQRVGEIVTS